MPPTETKTPPEDVSQYLHDENLKLEEMQVLTQVVLKQIFSLTYLHKGFLKVIFTMANRVDDRAFLLEALD